MDIKLRWRNILILWQKNRVLGTLNSGRMTIAIGESIAGLDKYWFLMRSSSELSSKCFFVAAGAVQFGAMYWELWIVDGWRLAIAIGDAIVDLNWFLMRSSSELCSQCFFLSLLVQLIVKFAKSFQTKSVIKHHSLQVCWLDLLIFCQFCRPIQLLVYRQCSDRFSEKRTN